VDAGAGYDGVYDGFNFNGYGKGAVLLIIPRGWKVTVHCTNRSGSLRHSCAIVRGVGATAPGFPHASSPDPERGLPPRRAATFTFVASKTGVYRLASLVRGQEQAGMWDVFEVEASGTPSVQLLRR
jgi:Sulfocyanin (SoxE) domain